jgi:ATP-dependent helicase/nuclease subunit A
VNKPAYRIDGRDATREAFYAVACDPRRSVVVEACAGAGKTWMLVSRILRALLDGAQPHEILAITFTRKAAGEMRERLAQWLREFADGEDAQRVAALVERGVDEAQAAALAPALAALREQVLRSGRGVEVRTFHAWFSQLMRAAPLELLDELGLQPRMELIEDIEDLLPDLFRRFHTRVLLQPESRDDYLALVRERGRSQCAKWLLAALDKRVEIELADAAGTLERSVDAVDLGGLAHPADELLQERWHGRLRELALDLGRGGMKAQEAATGLVLALDESVGPSRFDAAWAALFTQAGTPRKHLGKPATLAVVQAGLEALAARIHAHEAFVEHGRMLRLARMLLREYAALKRERALVDMSDLERVALALLRDATLAGWVQERLDARVRHVLIDEFQDTSPLQWQALHSWLSSYAGAGGGASGQRPPSLFIVGDPKQSIYRFRRAEPRVFEAARAFVAQGLDGALLECDHTRRNAPGVIALLNQVFDAAQRQGAFAGYRAHTTQIAGAPAVDAARALPSVARPARDKAGDGDAALRSWRPSLSVPRREPERVLREHEARHVALAVHELIAQGMPPGEIFVLGRKRASLRLAAAALQALHVPYAAPEDFPLLAAPEVRDLLALLDVLASPGHDLSLAQTLKSPLFGVGDDALLMLSRAAREQGATWWSALMRGEGGSLQRARQLLARWRDAARELPPHDLLDRIVAEGDLLARLAAAVPPARRAAAQQAVEAVLAQSLELDGGRYATPYGFVRALRRRALKATPPVQPDAVQLLTVHGAKGLEARVVFVMDAEPEAQHHETATLLVDWPVESTAPRRCAFVYSESRCPPSLAGVLTQERAAREREELNGLYVAITRAKQSVVFSRVQPHRGAAQPSWWHRVQAVLRPWTPATARAPLPADAVARLRELPALAMGEPRAAAARGDDATARLGQAVHRVLEWACGPAGHRASQVQWGPLAAAAVAEFALPADAADEVQRLARAMLTSPAAAGFFGDPSIEWAGNEVPVSVDGESLRIDRLVARREADGRRVWWVLDYKLQHRPQDLAGYREQMRRYRDALRRAQPGDAVRCAFVTGAGEVLEATDL